ncbi:MAG: RNA polymerase factor sigma-54 [Planctomycetota bacterium]
MRLDVSLQQKLQLQLKLAPQIIQSIEILQLPAIDLREMIDQELSENETLEVLEEREETPESALDEANRESHEDKEYEELFERLESISEESWDLAPRRNFLTEDGKDRKLEALQNTASPPPRLTDSLVDQLTFANVPERIMPVVRAIIFSLKPSGYLQSPLEDIVRFVNAGLNGELPFTVEEAGEALAIVQDLEPRGIGARTTQECLLLQLDPDDPRFEVKRRIVSEFLEDVGKNRLPKVARDLGISIEDLSNLVEELGHLNPRPGTDIASEETHYIQPDVVVQYLDGEYEVLLQDDYFPTLMISPRYLKMLQQNKEDPKVREHIKKKIESARWLIDSIEQRQNTLQKVVRAIIARQKDYLDFGISHLRPLKMQEIADELGIHVSTVSRAISDKYMQSHRGINALKFFFTGGTETDDGAVESRVSVKQKVKEIIDAEDKKRPLSDEEIAQRLQGEKLNIARRTVTKYRKQLGLKSSRQRRVWT